jgi:hypothetical protein
MTNYENKSSKTLKKNPYLLPRANWHRRIVFYWRSNLYTYRETTR